MSGKLTYYSVAATLTMTLNGMTDITKMMPRLCCLYSLIKCLFSSAKKVFNFWNYLTDTKSVARITVKTIENASTIYGDYLSLLKNALRVRNAMHNYRIERSAYTSGERPSIWIRTSLERRDSPVVSDKLLSNLIQLEGRYTWLYMTANLCKRFTNKQIGLTHQFNLILCLQKYIHPKEED